jgi:5-methylcytosine-specific restriction endonuclease McrA
MGRHKFYSSKKWQDCRNAYASSKRWLCERCLAKGLYHKGSIVHHKIYIDDDNLDDDSITLNFDNLELLCRSCHELEHKARERRYKVTESGELVF